MLFLTFTTKPQLQSEGERAHVDSLARSEPTRIDGGRLKRYSSPRNAISDHLENRGLIQALMRE